MKVTLKRIAKKEGYTIGNLYIDGVKFCDTLEDTDRGLNAKMSLAELQQLKQKGVTAIPTGTYRITLNVVSPKYGNREPYKSVCGGRVPRLIDVPAYEGVLIHIGNYPKDTEGCILLGKNTIKGQITNSTETWKAFYAKIKGASDLVLTIE